MTIEVTAKKVDDAINQGLAQLGATADEVDIEVLDVGGLFRKAKVRLTLEREQKEPQKSEPQKSAPAPKAKEAEQKPAEAVKPEQPQAKQPQKEKNAQAETSAPEKKAQKEHKKQTAPVAKEQAKPQAPEKKEDEPAPHRDPEADKAAAARAVEFITEVVAKMGFTDAVVQPGADGLISITAPPRDDSLLIGRHGETLSALSYIAETCARAEKCHINVTVDCNGYRERRAASLTAMAKRRANECVAKNRKIKLEAMERVDRRTIHNALNDDERVTTASEGKEPYRYVVILPKKQGK